MEIDKDKINCLNSKILSFVDKFDINRDCPFYKIFNFYIKLNFSDLANVYDFMIVTRRTREKW